MSVSEEEPALDRLVPVGERRPGGRSARVRAAVLAATLEELAVHGPGDLSVDAVAERAGVHKTTVYRRWPTRVGLIADALAERAADALPVPDTGDIAADLRMLARGAARRLQAPHPDDQSRMMLVTAVANPELAQIASAYWAQRFAAVGGRVQAAIAAGQLPEATDPAAVVRAIAAPLFFRVLVTHEPLTEAIADRVAAIALKLAGEGLLTE